MVTGSSQNNNIKFRFQSPAKTNKIMTSNSEKKPVDLGLLEEGKSFDNFYKLLTIYLVCAAEEGLFNIQLLVNYFFFNFR